MAETFIRFVIDKNHPESGRKMGLFMAMQQLDESNELFSYEKDLIKKVVLIYHF